MGMDPPVAPTEFANATVSDMAQAMKSLAEGSDRTPGREELPPGVDVWVRPFRVEWVDRPLSASPSVPSGQHGDGRWTVLGIPGDGLADTLRERLQDRTQAGVLVCLPAEDKEAVEKPLNQYMRLAKHYGSRNSN